MRRRASARFASAFVALGASWLAAPDAQAQSKDAAAEPPGLDFLEYLGSWQAADDEWYEIAEWDKDNPERDGAGDEAGEPRRDAKGEGDESRSGGDRRKADSDDAPPTEERP
jgi:hypothetical protein